MKTKICKSCGYVGKPIHDDPSSIVIDFIVWAVCAAVAGITMIFPIILIAPIFSLIHMAKFRTMKCPKCENLDMVSVHSHTGEEIMSPHKGLPQPWTDKGHSLHH